MDVFRIILVLALGLGVAGEAWAQQGAQGAMIQGGAVSAGHAPVAIQAQGPGANIYGDGGTALDGNFTELGITNTGTPWCITDVPRTTPGGYHQLCLGANSLGGGLLSYNAYNGAPTLPFHCILNGGDVGNCFSPGAGGVTGTGVVGYVPTWGSTTSLTNGVPTGHYYTSSGALIDRMADRVFVGRLSNVNDGNSPSTTTSKDWLESIRPASTSVAQVSSLSQFGAIGLLGGTRTSDITTANGAGEAVTGWCVNNSSAVDMRSCWGFYGEAHMRPGVNIQNQATGIEVDPVNWVNQNVALIPYLGGSYGGYLISGAGATIGETLASGGSYNTPALGSNTIYNTSAALYIANNGSQWLSGIVIGGDAIHPVGGEVPAIQLGQGYAMQWFESATGTEAASIRSDNSVAGTVMNQIFNQGVVTFLSNGSSEIVFDPATGGQGGLVWQLNGGTSEFNAIAAMQGGVPALDFEDLGSAKNFLAVGGLLGAGNVLIGEAPGKFVSVNGGLILTKLAFSSLPACASLVEGQMYSVTDSNSATFNAVMAGGGTNHVIAYCNGTNWTVH